VPALTFIT